MRTLLAPLAALLSAAFLAGCALDPPGKGPVADEDAACREEDDDSADLELEVEELSPDEPPLVELPLPPAEVSCRREGGNVRLTWRNPQPYAALEILRGREFYDDVPGETEEYVLPDDAVERFDLEYQVIGYDADRMSDYAECSLEPPPGWRREPVAPEPQPQPDPWPLHEAYVARYGRESSAPIHADSFVFIDGRYIESPYVISRQGLTVFINDVPVSPLPPFTFQTALPTITEPEPPPALATLSLKDRRFEAYVQNSWWYLCASADRKRLEEEEGIRELFAALERFLEALPGVEGISRTPLGNILIVQNGGGRRAFQFGFSCAWVHEPTLYTEETQLEGCRQEVASYAYLISRGDDMARLIHPAGGAGHISTHVRYVAELLAEVRRARQSGASFVPQGSLWVNCGPIFLENFVENEQLDRRLEAALRGN